MTHFPICDFRIPILIEEIREYCLTPFARNLSEIILIVGARVILANDLRQRVRAAREKD